MADDLGNQLSIQQQINKVLKEQSGLLTQQARLLSQQAGYAKDMCNALDCGNLEELTSQSQELKDGLKEAADQADNTAESLSGLEDAAKDANDAFRNKAIGIGAAAGAFRGFMGAMKLGAGLIGGLFKVVTSLAGSFFNLAQSILAAPFKMLTALIKMSQRGAIDPLRVALEEVRDVMGSLATNEGASLKGSVKELRKEMGNMAGTGLSMARVFGYGREGLAEFLKQNLELTDALGTSFSGMAEDLKGNYLALSMYRKGLGLTNEQQALSLKLAQRRGKDIVAEQDAFASMAIQMGKSFNINAKVVAKSMAKMQDDVSTFGHMSKKQFASAAVYVHQLGVEIEDLGAMFDKFDNFENAAKGAAELAQTFGMSIDPIKMLKHEDPAAMMDDLRKAFYATGRSIEDMNRHERNLLETQTGLKGAALEAAFGLGNQGLAYSDIQAAAEDAEKSQLTQAEAMKELSDSIKKLVKDGSHDFDSFFDAFAKGFTRGIEKSREFRKIMRNLQRSLRTVWRAGRRVGRAFVKFFPGIKEVAKALGDLFDPTRFKRLAKRVTGIFTTFFKDMHQSPQKAVKKLFDSLLKMFTSHFGSSGVHLKRIALGFRKFFVALGGIVSGLIPIIKEKIAEALEGIIDLIVNPPGAVLGKAGKAGKSFVMDVFGPIWEALTGNPELNKRIFDGLKNLGNMILKKLKAVDWSPVTKVLEGIMYKMIFFSVMSTLGGTLLGAITGGLGNFFKKAITDAAAKGAAAAAPGVAASLANVSPGQLASQGRWAELAGAPKPPTAALSGMGGAMTTAEAAAPSQATSASAASKIPAMLAAVGIILAAMGLIFLAVRALDVTPKEAAMVGGLTVAMAASALLMAPAMKMMGETSIDGSVLPKIAALGLALGVMGLVGVGVAAAIKAMEPMPDLLSVMAWGAIMAGMMAVSLPMLASIFIISKMQMAIGEAVKAMVVLGVLMAGVGIVGAVIALMLKDFKNPEGIAALMEAITMMMVATAIMVPPAAALGLLLTGTFGVAAVPILAGFAAMQGLALGIVTGMLPAVNELVNASNKIQNVEKFKAIATVMVELMGAVNTFMSASGDILKTLKPPSGDPKIFATNMEKFKELINAMMKSGVHEVFDKMMILATSTNVTEAGTRAIGAIAKILGAVGRMLQAMSPSGEQMAAVRAAVDESIDDTDAVRLLSTMNRHIRLSMPLMGTLLGTIGDEMGKLIDKLKPLIASIGAWEVDPKAIAAVGDIVGSVMGGMGAFMSGLAPLVESAQKNASKHTNAHEVMVWNLREIGTFAGTMAGVLEKNMGPLKRVIDSLIEVAKGLPGGKKLKGLGKKISVLGDVFGLMSTVQSAFGSAAMGAVEGEGGGGLGAVLSMRANMDAVRTKLLGKNGPMQLFIDAIGDLKKPPGVPTWKYLKKKAKRLGGAMEGVSVMMTSVATMGKTKITTNHVVAMQTNITNMTDALASMNKALEKPGVLGDPKKLANVGKAIQTLDDLLSSPLAQTVQKVEAFKFGELRVTHNLPKTNIQVTVNLSAKDIAKAVTSVNLTKATDPGGVSSIATNPEAATRSL